MRYPGLLILGAALGLLPSCSKSSGSAPTFGLMFEAPGGSGLAGGDGGSYTYTPTHTVDFNLLQGVTVSGQVTDGAGTPMPGVNVSFRSAASAPSIDGDGTDGSGNYSVTVPAGTWVAVLTPADPTFGTMTVTGNAVAAPGPVTLNFQFPAKVGVTGMVFESGGAANPSATVEFTGSQTGAVVTATADGSGIYATTLLPDTYDVVVTPAGAAATTELKQRFRGVLVNGATARNFTLTRGTQVVGLVRDNLGAPLLEATDIEVILPDGSDFFAPAAVTASASDGSYSIGPVPPGNVTFDLEAPDDSGFPKQRLTRNILPGTTQIEDFTLARGFVLSGTVRQDDGTTPEANVDVDLAPTNGSLAPDGDTTDGAGFYEVSVFAGTYQITYTPTTANNQLPEVQTVTVTADTTHDVTLTLGAILSGTVFQPDGTTPEPDVRVEIPGVLGASAVSDGSGNYSFLAPLGTHTVALTATAGTFDGFALDSVGGVVVSAPGPVTQNFTMALATAGNTVVTGTVFQPDGTTPVQGATVTARDNATGVVRGKAVTDGLGNYVLVVM